MSTTYLVFFGIGGVIGTIALVVLGMIGWNAWGNRRRRARLEDSMQRSRMGRPR